MRHADPHAQQRWGRPPGNMTTVYADFLGNELKCYRFGAGSGRGMRNAKDSS